MIASHEQIIQIIQMLFIYQNTILWIYLLCIFPVLTKLHELESIGIFNKTQFV